MAVVVVLALALKQFASASEDDVGPSQQFGFAPCQFRRRETKFRKLIHAVVHREPLIHLPGERGDSHGIVEPLDGRVEIAIRERTAHEFLNQAASLAIDKAGVVPTPRRELQTKNCQVRKIFRTAEARYRRSEVRIRCDGLNEQDFVTFAQPRNELLGPLPHPIPAQMTMDNDWIICGQWPLGG